MKLFYEPTAQWRWLLSFGGVRAARRLLAGDAAMRRAARLLPPAGPGSASPFTASYLTGASHWQQTAFAAWSLAQVLPQGLAPTFFDDGTLRPEQRDVFHRLFPLGSVVSRSEVVARLDASLPAKRYPLIREAEKHSIFFRKLVGLRAGSKRWQLYLDSDMLFFRRPEALEEAAHSRRGLYMRDHIFAYCLPQEEIDALAGYPVRPRVNGGLVGLPDDLTDWDRVESWLGRMPAAARSHGMLEQTVAAMLVSPHEPIELDPEAYQILYSADREIPREATMLHYIYHSKLLFVTSEWQRVRDLHRHS